MHSTGTEIHLLQQRNTYLKKSRAALHAHYLHFAKIPT